MPLKIKYNANETIAQESGIFSQQNLDKKVDIRITDDDEEPYEYKVYK